MGFFYGNLIWNFQLSIISKITMIDFIDFRYHSFMEFNVTIIGSKIWCFWDIVLDTMMVTLI